MGKLDWVLYLILQAVMCSLVCFSVALRFLPPVYFHTGQGTFTSWALDPTRVSHFAHFLGSLLLGFKAMPWTVSAYGLSTLSIP